MKLAQLTLIGGLLQLMVSVCAHPADLVPSHRSISLGRSVRSLHERQLDTSGDASSSNNADSSENFNAPENGSKDQQEQSGSGQCSAPDTSGVVPVADNSTANLWSGQLSWIYAYADTAAYTNLTRNYLHVATAVGKVSPYYMARKVFRARDEDLDPGEVANYYKTVNAQTTRKRANMTYSAGALDGVDIRYNYTVYMAEWTAFPGTGYEIVALGASHDLPGKFSNNLWLSFVDATFLSSDYLPCVWDAQRGSDKSFSEIFSGTPEEQQIYAYQLILGKKAVAIEINSYDNDDGLKRDLMLADGQAILCNFKNTSMVPLVLSTYDANSEKFLLGMRFPEDFSKSMGAGYSQAYTLADFKTNVASIVKVENNDEAEVPPCRDGC